MARNRVIYQSEALFVSPNSTGAHFSCTAVLTGLGPTGLNTTAPIPTYKGESGNAPGLYTLTNPVGLTQDPAITWEGREAGWHALGEDLNKATLSTSNLSAFDIRNISGSVTSSFTGALDAIYSNAVNGGGATTLYTGSEAGFRHVEPATATAARTLINNQTGDVLLFTSEEAWNHANQAYYQPAGTSLTPIANKNISAVGVFLQPFSGGYENLVQQVHRVQSANYSFTINRTDVNTFGQLARIDAIALEPPTVNLDFTYYPTDGFNERNLGFYVQGADNVGLNMGSTVKNASSEHLKSDNAGKSYFILTTPESTDAFSASDAISERSVIGLGNGFLSDYTIEAAVGSIPTANSTVELYNAKSDLGTTGVSIPGVNLQEGRPVTGIKFSLGHPEALRGDDNGASPSTGQFGVSSLTALRPGDVTLEIPEELSMLSKVSGDGSIHIQNFSLSMPLSRSPIDRLGTRFAFSRVVDLPVTASLSVSALMSDIGTGNLANLLDDCKEHDIRIKIKGQNSCEAGAPKIDAMTIDFKGARIDSESISSDIGSNKSIDLSFTTQIGGPTDLIHGVFISGANRNVIEETPRIPNF
jgi:hypothetical protein